MIFMITRYAKRNILGTVLNIGFISIMASFLLSIIFAMVKLLQKMYAIFGASILLFAFVYMFLFVLRTDYFTIYASTNSNNFFQDCMYKEMHYLLVGLTFIEIINFGVTIIKGDVINPQNKSSYKCNLNYAAAYDDEDNPYIYFFFELGCCWYRHFLYKFLNWVVTGTGIFY